MWMTAGWNKVSSSMPSVDHTHRHGSPSATLARTPPQGILTGICAVGDASALVPKRQRHAVCRGVALAQQQAARGQRVGIACGVHRRQRIRSPDAFKPSSVAHPPWAAVSQRRGATHGAGSHRLRLTGPSRGPCWATQSRPRRAAPSETTCPPRSSVARDGASTWMWCKSASTSARWAWVIPTHPHNIPRQSNNLFMALENVGELKIVCMVKSS